MRRIVPLLLTLTLTLVGLGIPGTAAQAAPTTGFRFVDIGVGER